MEYIKKTYLILSILFVILLPFNYSHIQFKSVVIGLLLITWIIQVLFYPKTLTKLNYVPLLFFVAYYGLFLIGMIYTSNENLKMGWRNLEVKLSLLVLPLIFFSTQTFTRKEVNTILITFVISCIITSLFALQIAVSQNYQTNQLQTILWKLYSNQVFARPIGMHASYLSWYIAFAIGTCIFFLIFAKKKLSLLKKGLLFLSIIYLLFLLALLGAKMMMVAFIMSTFLLSLYYAYQKKIFFKALIMLTIITVSFITIFLANPANQERFKKAIDYKGQYEEKGHFAHSGTRMRWDIWQCAISLIKQKPILGYGTGEAQQELNNCYKENDYWAILYWKNMSFNSHNEFFQTTLAIGLLGFFSLSFLIIYLLYHSITSQNILLLFFLLISLGLMLVEAIFKIQAGVIFFSFFCSILYPYTNDLHSSKK